jgi:hypothetical protein
VEAGASISVKAGHAWLSGFGKATRVSSERAGREPIAPYLPRTRSWIGNQEPRLVAMSTFIPHVWKPSDARIIAIDSFVPVPRGSAAVIPALLSWPSKDPGDVLDYQVDIRPALYGNESDTIEGVDISIDPGQSGDLALTNALADGSKVIMWLSGGQPGTTYTITIKVELASGRAIQRSILLPVLQLSSVVSPLGAIETSVDVPLTDQDGNPILYQNQSS